MKLNNKGFAISGILYPIFILFIVLILGIIGNLATSKAILDLTNYEIEMELNGDSLDPVISYLGSDITIANGYSYTPLDDVEAFTYDGKQISTDKISYESEPAFSTSINDTYTVTYTVTDGKGRTATSVRTIKVESSITYEYAYTGSSQTFTSTYGGIYKVELWGAQGGGTAGGEGSYVKGNLSLTSATTAYIYVGEYSTTANGTSFNGGTATGGFYPGGGATDMRLTSGTWTDTTSLRSRIMVAAGGGAGNVATKSQGGALTGLPGNTTATGGGQTAGGTGADTYSSGTFGVGGSGCGGGGGYYGGGGATCANAAGGGSSFISGHTGVNAINSGGTHTGTTIHFSGLYFTSTQMIAGDSAMTAPNGASETGHTGNGYARITVLKRINS